MAILYPIAIPAMYAVGVEAGLGNEELLTYIVHIISVVLAAAVLVITVLRYLILLY